MKRLSEFKNEEGVRVIAKLLQPVFRIGQKVKDIPRPVGMTAIELVSIWLENCPEDVIEIFAILSETPVEEYECNGASIMANTLKLASDTELMELFGLQSQTQTSSGSASETTEGH